MESIGIYWMPIYEILEDAFSGGITLLVVNALKLLVIIYTMLKQGPPLMNPVLRQDVKAANKNSFPGTYGN